MTYPTFQNLIYMWMALGAGIFVILLNVTAPYGRYATPKWGIQISNNLGWVIMEAPAMILLMYFVIVNSSRQTAMSWTLIAFFMFHYINRTFIFPFRIRTKGKKIPVLIVTSGVSFNLVNGFLIGYYFGYFAKYDNSELFGMRFLTGTFLFILGVVVNWNYDNKLIHLRRPDETDYLIPQGKLFELISCPNLLGEVIEWTGYAIMCWNLPAISFLVWTIANLVPRALAHHKWYNEHFENYPAERKAIFPFIL
jgi:3-oxo-5-alpha-steroid 4-dehydrogenase 1